MFDCSTSEIYLTLSYATRNEPTRFPVRHADKSRENRQLQLSSAGRQVNDRKARESLLGRHFPVRDVLVR